MTTSASTLVPFEEVTNEARVIENEVSSELRNEIKRQRLEHTNFNEKLKLYMNVPNQSEDESECRKVEELEKNLTSPIRGSVEEGLQLFYPALIDPAFFVPHYFNAPPDPPMALTLQKAIRWCAEWDRELEIKTSPKDFYMESFDGVNLTIDWIKLKAMIFPETLMEMIFPETFKKSGQIQGAIIRADMFMRSAARGSMKDKYSLTPVSPEDQDKYSMEVDDKLWIVPIARCALRPDEKLRISVDFELRYQGLLRKEDIPMYARPFIDSFNQHLPEMVENEQVFQDLAMCYLAFAYTCLHVWKDKGWDDITILANKSMSHFIHNKVHSKSPGIFGGSYFSWDILS